jgi:hypothetical protein
MLKYYIKFIQSIMFQINKKITYDYHMYFI